MKKICKYCNTEFEAKSKAMFCSDDCKSKYFNHLKFPDGSDYLECKICGFRARQLTLHIQAVHNMSCEEYCNKFNIEQYDLTISSMHEKISKSISKACKEGKCGWVKGGKNPSQSEECKSGRRSAWSMNYRGYDGLTDEEKKAKISKLSDSVVSKMNDNHNNPLRIDYYTSRGYSEKEAKEMLKQRQTTFSKEKCIEKYGYDDGIKIFNERQEKWQETLNSKSPEEIERITRAKMCEGRGYSKISQKLFKSIDNIIHDEYTHIYYATSIDDNSFSEYVVVNDKTKQRYFLDFYVKDNNKVIEFDGEYWHGEKRGNQERDRKREEELKSLGYENILHVRERDYRSDPDKVIRECVEYIRK